MLCHCVSFAENQTANSKLDTTTIRIGEQIYFYIYCETKDTNIVWPNFKDELTTGIEILEKSKIDTILKKSEETILYSQNFLITAWDSGRYHIPEIIFNQKTKTSSITLNVNTILIAEDALEKDIKKPLEEPYGWVDIFPYILALLGAGIFFYIFQKYIKKRKKKIEEIWKGEEIVKNPCDVIALESLERLKNENLWKQGKVKEYHSRISEILRIYIEKRYAFIAMELPTEDILINLKKNTVQKNIITDLDIILRRADLAKFAKSKPNDIENQESMDLAENFVKKTRL